MGLLLLLFLLACKFGDLREVDLGAPVCLLGGIQSTRRLAT